MGIVFVIFIHLIFIFILSSIIAFFGGLIFYLLSKENRQKRKLFLVGISPYLFLYTIYFLALIGSIIVSENKNVDIGIGDSWYVPINDSYQILMIDLPEQASIQYKEESLISDVSHIEQIKEKVYGKTFEGKYFSLNLANNIFTEYDSRNELLNKERLRKLDLIKTIDFYDKRKWEISGTATIIVGILSLLISLTITIIFWKLVLYGFKIFERKKTTANTC